MPDKARVLLTLRISREDGGQELAAAGTLYRLATGWAVTCRLPESAGAGEADGESEMTLVAREGEIRMNRKGAFTQEQVFRLGEWRSGTVGTAFGAMPAEAWTHRVQVDLTSSGGTIEWEYDLRVANQELGRSSIMLHIQEEQR